MSHTHKITLNLRKPTLPKMTKLYGSGSIAWDFLWIFHLGPHYELKKSEKALNGWIDEREPKENGVVTYGATGGGEHVDVGFGAVDLDCDWWRAGGWSWSGEVVFVCCFQFQKIKHKHSNFVTRYFTFIF